MQLGVGSITDDTLVGELDALGIHFLTGGDARREARLSPTELLSGLAASLDTRVQLAVIPLLLTRPDFAEGAMASAQQLHGRTQSLFCCIYTAAVYLQRKYIDSLVASGLPTSPLPDLFAMALGLSTQPASETALRSLAMRQQQLLADASDWFGAYEYAVARLLRRRQKELQWST